MVHILDIGEDSLHTLIDKKNASEPVRPRRHRIQKEQRKYLGGQITRASLL